jgi:hypothetical protein
MKPLLLFVVACSVACTEAPTIDPIAATALGGAGASGSDSTDSLHPPVPGGGAGGSATGGVAGGGGEGGHAAAPANGGFAAAPASGGGPGGMTAPRAFALLSDFEQPTAIVLVGAPPGDAGWYAYNDRSAGCTQLPAPGQPLVTSPPPVVSPAGGDALHVRWDGCTTWGAGIGAHIGRPPIDLRTWRGVRFWVAAFVPDVPIPLRVTFPMIDDAKPADGGTCDEPVGEHRCNDAYGLTVSIEAAGQWSLVTIDFKAPELAQAGWGARFPWDPARVLALQIQGVDLGAPYDFWIDGVELVP